METIIRVLVANRPRLLRELVMTTLSEQAGISVVGETDNERDVPSPVGRRSRIFC
jgi:DNA-binding NarL/FixJ family response regulator